MIVYFLLIILVNIISGDDVSDTKYIETLPASVRKSLLDKVARRILNEVPDVNSRDTDVNGDILADKLEEQSEFVKRILKQEIASLKARRSHFRKFKKFRKSGNGDDQLSGVPDYEKLEKNGTQISDLDAKESVSDKMDADAGHIDLTMRAARSKRDDSFLNVNHTTTKNATKDGLTKAEHGNHDGDFVPVEIELDGEKNDRDLIKGSNKNMAGETNVQKDEDIQIRFSKQGEEKKSGKVKKETSDFATEKADNVDEPTTQSHFDSESTLKSEDTSLKMHFGRRSEDLVLNKTDEIVDTATVNVSTISDSLNRNLNDTKTSEDYIKTLKIVDTTVADVKDSSLEIEDDTKNKTAHVSKYSSESYLENPIIDNKGRKKLEVLNSDEFTTKTTEETSVKSKSDVNNISVPVTEDPHNNYSEITPLHTMETPYIASTATIQPAVEKSTNIVGDVRTNIQKDFEATNKNSKEDNKLTVTKISTATQTGNASTHAVSKSSKTVNANDTRIYDKKPCNETSSKVGIITDCDTKRNKTDNSTTKAPNVTDKIDNEPKVKITVGAVNSGPKDSLQNDNKKPCNETSSKVGILTDCDKKLNKTDNSTPKTPKLTEVHEVDNEPKVKATVEAVETEPKASLRTSDPKPLYDSLIHFGDMQINKEYEVYEVDSGKTAFIKQKEKNKDERSSIEQPRYAPVYNYDPENAYFNAYNRLGPNENDKDDDDSAASDLGNEHVVRSKTLRMFKSGKELKKKYYKKAEDVDSNTKPYYSKEESFEENECKQSKENDESKKEEVFEPLFYEDGHIDHPYTKNHLNHVRHNNFKNKLFGYAPTPQERKRKLAKEARYLYNNVLGKSTEEILDITKDGKKYFRTNDDGRYGESLDASEDKTDNTRKDANDDKKIEVVVLDMNENGTSLLRHGGYFSSKYQWDEERNSFRNEGKEYNLDHIVPYSTEKSIILSQRKESNKIFDRIKDFFKPSADNNSAETVAHADPEDAKKAIEHLKNLDTDKTLFNKSSINEMATLIENFAHPPRHFQYLKQRLAQSRHQSEMQNTHAILRSPPCHKPSNCAFQIYGLKIAKPKQEPAKYKAPNNVLNSIDKITKITPEIDMLQNIQPMLQVNGFPIARSREDDVELYVRILRDMVKMDNKALEEYDWLGTTVAIQSALAKLREIIDQMKNGQRIHPSDLQLFKYVEALYTKASEVTKEEEGETLDEHIRDLKQDRKANNERMALPKTHRKIKNPWKILVQISDLMKKKVLRDKINDRTKNVEVFLDCMQQCLDDFHTAIKELTRITKYNQQRWYKNIKELYLSAGGRKEYLEVLLHLYSMKLFSLIEGSAENGAEVNYRMYMKDNRLEVDRAQAEIVFVIRILKAIHDHRVN